MSQGKSGRETARKELLEDETNLANTGTDLDSLVQEVLQSKGKPKKLSVLLPNDPNDFIGNEGNDYEKERQNEKYVEQRELQEKEKSSQRPESSFGVLESLSPTELEDHYMQCLKLCSQNDVDVKNAFKLQLIDYMKLICVNQSKMTENFALMGYTLDACAKIYSFRVDKVYADLMKVMSGKDLKETEGAGEDENQEEGGEHNHESDDDVTMPKKKKKNYEEEKHLDFEKLSPQNFNCQDEEPEVNMLVDDADVGRNDNDGCDDQQSFSPSPDDPSGTLGGLELPPAPPKVNPIRIIVPKTEKTVDN